MSLRKVKEKAAQAVRDLLFEDDLERNQCQALTDPLQYLYKSYKKEKCVALAAFEPKIHIAPKGSEKLTKMHKTENKRMKTFSKDSIKPFLKENSSTARKKIELTPKRVRVKRGIISSSEIISQNVQNAMNSTHTKQPRKKLAVKKSKTKITRENTCSKINSSSLNLSNQKTGEFFKGNCIIKPKFTRQISLQQSEANKIKNNPQTKKDIKFKNLEFSRFVSSSDEQLRVIMMETKKLKKVKRNTKTEILVKNLIQNQIHRKNSREKVIKQGSKLLKNNQIKELKKLISTTVSSNFPIKTISKCIEKNTSQEFSRNSKEIIKNEEHNEILIKDEKMIDKKYPKNSRIGPVYSFVMNKKGGRIIRLSLKNTKSHHQNLRFSELKSRYPKPYYKTKTEPSQRKTELSTNFGDKNILKQNRTVLTQKFLGLEKTIDSFKNSNKKSEIMKKENPVPFKEKNSLGRTTLKTKKKVNSMSYRDLVQTELQEIQMNQKRGPKLINSVSRTQYRVCEKR